MKGKRWLSVLLAAAMLLPQTMLLGCAAQDIEQAEMVLPAELQENGALPEEEPEQTQSVKNEAANLEFSESGEAVKAGEDNSGVSIREMIYENDFTNTTIDKNMTFTTDGGSINIADGKLNIVRSTNSGTTIADIYAMEDHTAVSGLIGVEYTLHRSNASKTVQQRLRMTGSSDYIALTWAANKSVSSIHSDTYGVDGKGYSVSFNDNNTMKVKAYMDTSTSKFSLWLNDELVLKDVYSRAAGANKLTYVRLYLEGNHLNTLTVDDFKIYYAQPPAEDAIAMDQEWLTDARIMTGAYVSENIIMHNLSLPTKGAYNSDITWETSDSELIRIEQGEDGNLVGVVNRPANANNPEVTVTAHLSIGGLSVDKEFRFRILRNISNDQESVEAEAEALEALPWYGEPTDAVITSLDLRTNGLYGTKISWVSSNQNVITNSGRVIRPRSDKQNETVTMTATITAGSAKTEKSFELTVLKDEEYTDPGWISDEDFFGVWNGRRWTTTGKFDYSISGLAGVEAAVKEGDYVKAKEELLAYMKIRNQAPTVNTASRNSGWANMCLAGVYNLQGGTYYEGDGMIASHDYQSVNLDIGKSHISKGGTSTYSIIARYNEMSEAVIAGVNYPDAALRPKIEVVVNGQTRTYDAVDAAMIRAGNYMDTNYGAEEELKVKIFGEFLGDETYRTLIKFNFSDLSDADTVSSARLVLHAKVQPDFVDMKSLIVNYEPTNTWKRESVVWNTLSGYVYNMNGIPGGNFWDAIPGCDVEYTYQAPRFLSWRGMASEYNYTGDEKYAYFMIRDMMDFIWDRGKPVDYNGSGQWPKGVLIGMGYPRTLDTASRLEGWLGAWNALVKSPYMSPDCCSAILKGMWEMCNNLPKSKVTQGNWVQTENMCDLQGALFFPEFVAAEDWISGAQEKLEDLLFVNSFDDGSYIEATGGYSQDAYTNFLNYKKIMAENGHEVTAEYDKRLQELAYYNLLMAGPDGTKLQYGDERAGSYNTNRYPELVTWYGDHEIEYIDSRGSKGTMPEWSSRLFMESRTSYLRSDWTKNALYLFTNVRGGGQHGHSDDNAIIAMAYGRTLLNDAGIFTYTNTDPYRIWGKSSRAHNTVEINNTTQTIGAAPALENRGTVHEFRTNDSYDFLSQSTISTPGYDHQRTITFVKSGFWIVSDLMTPQDMNKANDYKQIWHMPPAAGITVDKTEMTMRSNYNSGANIIVASADKDAILTEEDGYYDYSYQQLTDAPFAYYEKKGVTGKATYDTVLFPYKNVGKGDIKVERIDMGVPTYEVTAMKFTVTNGNETTVNYYVMDYTNNPLQEKTIGNYKVCGKSATIVENAKGEVKDIYLTGGTNVTTLDGTKLIASDTVLKGTAVSYKGNVAEINSSGDELMYTGGQKMNLETLTLNTKNALGTVKVDGKSVAFKQEGTKVTLTDQPKQDKPVNDAHPGNGFGGGGGGGAVVPSTPTPTPSDGPQTTPTPTGPQTEFKDIVGHWAQSAIEDVTAKGVIKGKENDSFCPEDTVTRAELVAMMVRTLELEKKHYQGEFTDVSAEDWYAGEIQTALEAGIISKATEFRPDDQITREEMSKVVAVIAKKLNIAEELPEDYQVNFSDTNMISEWANDYVRFVSYAGLMSGMEDGSFRPHGSATRAEAATVISRMLHKAQQ